jgi:hypothetical protein
MHKAEPCALGIGISQGWPAGRALLAEGTNAFTEIVACKYLIPHVAGDDAGLLPIEPFDTLHEGHAFLDGRGTESGHYAGDFEGPDWRAVAHFVDQAKFARFGGKTDPPGEGKLQCAPLSEGTGDRPVNQEGPEPEADFGETETGLRTGHHDVAVGHQTDAAPEGRTIDAGDERFAEARPDGEELLVKGIDLPGMGALFDFGHVHAGAERPAVGGEEDGAHGRVASGTFQRLDKGAAKGGVQGVAFAGAIEGEVQQASLTNGMQKVSHGVWVGGRSDGAEHAVGLIIVLRAEMGKGGCGSLDRPGPVLLLAAGSPRACRWPQGAARAAHGANVLVPAG